MEEKIKYGDLISADDSISNLISQLEALNKTFVATASLIKENAAGISKALSSVSGATNQGRTSIERAAVSTSKLEEAYRMLAQAQTEEGRQLAYVKSLISDTNRASVEMKRQIDAKVGSYESLRLKLQSAIKEFKSLGSAERATSTALDVIRQTRDELKKLDDQLKPTVVKMTELNRIESELAKTKEKLVATQSKEYSELLRGKSVLKQVSALKKADIELEIQKKKAGVENIDTAKLQVYSYDLLSAAYKKLKLEVNAMTAADQDSLRTKREAEKQLLAIYTQMRKLQEATGNHTLSVGNYNKVWNGLGYSIQQVVRELPSAAISLNTLFLAMSNNIPIVIDEIKKMKVANEQAIAAGQKTTSITKTIMGSLFGLQTVLMLVITAFSMYGDKIISTISKMMGFNTAIESSAEMLETLTKALDKNDEGYGKNMASLSKLADQWDHLQESDRAKWVKHNATLFERLGVSIRNVNEAEELFASHERLDAVSQSLYQRAKAAAAATIAAEKFKQALTAEMEGNTLRESGPGFMDYLYTGAGYLSGGYSSTGTFSQRLQRTVRRRALEYEGEGNMLRLAAQKYIDIELEAQEEARKVLEQSGLRPYEGEGHASEKTRTQRELRDLTDRINRQSVELYKKLEGSKTELYQDELGKREKSAEDAYNVDVKRLENIRAKNESYLKGLGPRYKALTDEQKQQLREQNAWIDAITGNEAKRVEFLKAEIAYEKALRTEMLKRGSLGGTGSLMEKSIGRERDIKIGMLDNERDKRRYSNVNLENEGDPAAQAARDLEITQWYNRELAKVWAESDKEIYEIRLRGLDSQAKLVEKFSDEEFRIGKERIIAQKKIALASNTLADPTKQSDPGKISAEYNRQLALYEGSYLLKKYQLEVKAEQALASLRKKSSRQREVEELDFERKLMLKKLELYNEGKLNLSEGEVDALNADVTGNLQRRKELTGISGFIKGVGNEGLGGGILQQMGFDDDYISAMDDVTSKTLENINAIMEAEIALAEEEKRLADERVDAAQKVLDSEIEARNNGYASNVADAQRRLELEKRNQEKKAKILEQAQRRQEAINSVTQASSLVTASAQLWSTFSGMGPAGPALAIAAIAAMWASFAVSKVKAKQVAKAQQDRYGEGGLEILEGGSHASGNDIDLHTKNRKGRNMRAEGGEALAIINKRNTHRYRKVLPDIIESLNKGVFEQRYASVFQKGENLQAVFNTQNSVDVSRLESSVEAIRRRVDERIIPLGDGSTMIIKGNVKRIVR